MSSLIKIASGLLLITLAACDGIPGMQSAAALTRKGDPQACSHPRTKEALDRVVRGPERMPSAEEIEALPITFSDTTMTDAKSGVSVTCRTLVELSNGHTESFVYSVLLSSEDPGEIMLSWPNDTFMGPLALVHYADILYNWERRASRPSVTPSRSTTKTAPPLQPATAPEMPASIDPTMEMLYEHGGARVGFTSEQETICVRCGSDRAKVLDVGVGPGFVETSSGHWVVITENTGNAVPGGSSYAIDLRSGRTVDLKTHSAAGPEFEFKNSSGEFGVEVHIDGETRWVPLPA